MRPPVVDRRRLTRQQRLLRTATGIVLIVAVAALVANLVGDDAPRAPDEPPPEVSFVAKVTGETDAEKAPKDADIKAEGDQIVEVLNTWYFAGFVDPKIYAAPAEPETDPFAPVAALFDEEARDQLTADINAMTIGQARTELSGVDPTKAEATITVFFERRDKPRFATALVRFAGTGTMRDPSAFPLAIEQSVTVTLKKTSSGWTIAFWEASAKHDSIEPPPSPSPSPS